MTDPTFVDSWGTLTADARFAAFVTWLVAQNAENNGAVLAPDAIIRAELGSGLEEPFSLSVGGTPTAPSLQLVVWSGVFTSTEPNLALMTGQSVLMISEQIADDARLTAAEESARLAEEERQEQIDEWLDEMQQELIEAMQEAYEAMQEYFEEEQRNEEDLSS